MKRKLEDKGRVFQEKWENMYFFWNAREILRPICNDEVQVRTEYNFCHHYETIHREKLGHLQGKL